VTGIVRPVAEQSDIASTVTEQFRTPDGGATLATNNPLVKAALVCLAEAAPQALSFDELWARVCARLHAPSTEAGGEVLAEPMLQCFLSGLVELHVTPPLFVRELHARPVASPLARLQAEREARVTNRRQRTVELTELQRVILRGLDGSRQRADLLAELIELVAQEVFVLEHDGEPLRDPAQAQAILEDLLSDGLHRLADSALLVG
jgi:methyltransferase-like protein